MPRDSSGNYTLPAGNPVIAGTTITSDWANDTMSDMGNEMTNSLSRNGQGGMLAPLPFVDGAVNQPSITFNLEPTLGFYRAGDGIIGMTGLGDNQFAFQSNSGNISVRGLLPIFTADLTRKDYVDGLAKNSTIATNVNGLSGMAWVDLPAGLVAFYVSAANIQMGAAANILLRLGDSNTPEITGYSSLAANLENGVNPVVNNPNTTGFVMAAINANASDIVHGVYTGVRIGDSNNWIMTASFINLTSLLQYSNTGLLTLGGDILSIEILQSTGLFDAGTVGLTYQRNVV